MIDIVTYNPAGSEIDRAEADDADGAFLAARELLRESRLCGYRADGTPLYIQLAGKCVVRIFMDGELLREWKEGDL